MGCCKIKPKTPLKRSKSTEPEDPEPVPHISLISNLVSTRSKHFSDDYSILKIIGEGGSSQVEEVVENSSGCKRAVKTIKTNHLAQSEVENIHHEIKILKHLDHPGVIKIFQVYKEKECIRIVTDLCSGGELFDRVLREGQLSENLAARYMFDIVSTVKYLHEVGIMHRDLKPGNIMFEDSSESARLKIIDFGSAKEIVKGEVCNDIVGTPYYIAPEVLKCEYNSACDVWSIGVILYTLLAGKPPFAGSSNAEIYESILSTQPSFEGRVWTKVSLPAKNLIRKMLQKDPKKRISIDDIFFDPWLKTRAENLVPDKELSGVSMKNLSKFTQANKLQACTFVFLAHCFSTANELKHIRKLFESFDRNCDGKLSYDEIRKGILMYSDEVQINAEEVMKNCDLDKNGFIDYSEFLAAVCSTSLEISKQKLKVAFNAIDSDKSGKLSIAEIRNALVGITNEAIIIKLVKDIDTNGDGEIDFEEFANAILKKGMSDE